MCPNCGASSPQPAYSGKIVCGKCGKFLGFDSPRPTEDHPSFWEDQAAVEEIASVFRRARCRRRRRRSAD